jgi:hypothetical protein
VSYIDDVEPGDESTGEQPPAEPIDWVAKGRAEKADKLLAVIDANAREEGLDPIIDAEAIARMLRGWTDAQWLDLQNAAGIGLHKPAHRRKAPSEKTQHIVIERVSLRVDVAGEPESP